GSAAVLRRSALPSGLRLPDPSGDRDRPRNRYPVGGLRRGPTRLHTDRRRPADGARPRRGAASAASAPGTVAPGGALTRRSGTAPVGRAPLAPGAGPTARDGGGTGRRRGRVAGPCT